MTRPSKIPIRSLCLTGIFTAIITVCAQVSIPMPYGVPLTLQTLAIPLAGIVLGANLGALSVSVYVLLGAIGVPVFAGLTGGIGVILGPTGGFILSFPAIASIAGIGERLGGKLSYALGIITGIIVNYLCGMLFFCLVTSNDMKTAFLACVLPFIPSDVIKMSAAAVLGKSIKRALKNSALPT